MPSQPAAEPIRVMKLWSKDLKRTAIIANTKATYDAAYAGRLSLETGPHLNRDGALDEAASLAWIAAERAVAREQAAAYDAERSNRIAAAVEAQRGHQAAMFMQAA